MKAFLDDFKIIKIEEYGEVNYQSIYLSDGSNYLPFHINVLDNDLSINVLDDLDIEKDYYLYINDEKIKVEYRFIVLTNRFDELYLPDLSKLGSFYYKDKTVFRLWSPFSKIVNLIIDDHSYKMVRKERGVFEIEIKGDFEKSKYHFNLDGKDVDDPFSYVKYDDLDSFVIDVDKLNNRKIKLKDCECPIIYETSVRDFSSIGTPFKYPKTFRGMSENIDLDGHIIGLDYLKDLGITHLELLPVLSYSKDNSDYNWGYNPIGYNTFDNDYFYSNDPYDKINEFKELVNNYHKNNIRIILDVVFNHVYNVDLFNLSKYLKYYFFRYENNQLANGNGLGNELRNECPYLREYISIIVERLFTIYDIDGLRFDLAGYLSIETFEYLRNRIKVLKKDSLFIMEGWDMKTALNKEDCCVYNNPLKPSGCLYFNSFYRDTIKEYALGDESLRSSAKDVMCSINDVLNKSNSLNYLECHDGYTYFDYINNNSLEAFQIKTQRCRFGLALLLLSKGVPFIHSGQEFFRTKKGIENTYNYSDEYNLLDWHRMIDNTDSINYFKDLCQLRKMIYKYLDCEEYEFIDYYEAFIIKIKDIMICVNPCPFDHLYVDGNNYEILFDGNRLSGIITDGPRFLKYTVSVFRKIM